MRESIFVGAVRMFCSSFAAILGILIGIIVIFVGISMFSGSNMYPEKSDLKIEPDASGNVELLAETAPAILRIDFHGIIGEFDLTTQKIEKILRDSRGDMLKNNRVKAVLLHMNTPGGEVSNADGIYRALMQYKKKYQVPIFAYVDGLCASGGMYIVSAADKIYASPTSTIGSIGVILGPAFNFSQTMDKIGVQALTLTGGKDKDMLNPFRPWKEGEYQSLQTLISELYNRFVAIVTEARPKIDKDLLINEYGAQVYISQKAQEIGYIDVADSDYSTALTDLASEAHIPENQSVQVVRLEIPHPFLSQFVNGQSTLLSGKVTHHFQIGTNLSSEMSGKYLYLYQPSNG